MYLRFFVSWLLSLSLGCSPADMSLQADVCVYGGSEAAFTAAIQTARMGKSVILIEPTGHPGGMMVEGIAKDIRFGSHAVISGIARELYTNIETHYNRVPQFDSLSWSSKYEPHIAEAKIEDLLRQEKQLRIIRKQRIREKEGVEVDQQAIQRIWLEDGTIIQATVFIDASIEGDLLHQAGVSTATIREGNQAYDETKNGISGTNEYRQFLVAVDPYLIEGDSSSGLLPTIQPGELGTPGSPDKHIMGFCFRLVLTRDSSNRIPIVQPAYYDPATYEIYRRYLKAGGNLFKPTANRPKDKTDLGSWHDLSANLYGEDWRPFGISWQALLPKESECTNLISPSCVASSYVAYGAIRILPTFMMLGQAAGTAAALAVTQAIDVQAIHYPTLHDRLISDGLKLEIPQDWLYIITHTN